MQQFWKILQRELQLIRHDSDLFLLALIAPLFYSLFYGSLYINKTERDVPIAVVDCDRTPTSRIFIRSLDAHEMLSVSFTTSDMAEAKALFNTTDVQGIVYIPARFEAEVKGGKSVQVPVYVNTTHFLVSNDINKGVTSVALTLAAGVHLNTTMAKGVSRNQALPTVEPLRVEIRPLFNKTESYGDFLTPALLILVIQQLLFLLLGQAYAKEREEKSLAGLYELAGRNTVRALIGKTFFYFVLFCSYAMLFFTVHFGLFSLPLESSLFETMVFTLLFLVAVTVWILFVVSFFTRKILALQVIALTTYPIFLISGYSWPLASLPTVLRVIAECVPLTPYLAGFSRLTLMGANLKDVVPEILHLSLLAIAGALLTFYRYKVVFEKMNAHIHR